MTTRIRAPRFPSPGASAGPRDSLAADPDRAGRVFQEIVDGAAEGELAEALLVWHADDDRVDTPFDSLVHYCRPNLSGLEELRLDRGVHGLRNTLGVVEDPLPPLDFPFDLGVPRERPGGPDFGD